MNKKIADSISTILKRNEETLAVAESVTAGLIQYELSTAFEAQKFFEGGITTYNIPQKTKHLQVQAIHANAVNAVSQKVAIQMAENVCRLFGSDWGIAITGYASPVPESGNKIFAFFAIAKNKKIVLNGKISSAESTAALVQKDYAQQVLKKFSIRLQKK